MSTQRASRSGIQAQKLVYFAVFTALVIVLQCLASFVFPKIGLSLNLSLIPIVLGAALCNKWSGAWLGFVSSFIILFDPTTVGFMTFNAPATIFLVLLKGTAAGLAAGLIYSLLEKKNRYVALTVAAALAPIVNTGLFFGGCFTFFAPYIEEVQSFLISSGEKVPDNIVAFVIIVFIGINFLIEFAVNLLFVPVISRLIKIKAR